MPKGSKLDFEASGKLASTTVVASQRGTTVCVQKLFHNLPVRRRELERNIKREWHKAIALLNQYACVQTNLKFSVSQQPTKGKRLLLFSTRGNPTTRDNIINIFGSKAMSALVSLDLVLELQSSHVGPAAQGTAGTNHESRQVRILGHVSRPVHGDGRQTPDRQMFFINGRPCGLPQFARTFNDVYKSYNYSQSPFIFADIQLDTNMYDVNVSPDKRSILLHDQSVLLDSLRTSLMKLFDGHDHQIPTTQVPMEIPGCAKSFDDGRQPMSLRNSPSSVVKPGLSTTTDYESDDGSGSYESDSTEENPGKVTIQVGLSTARGRRAAMKNAQKSLNKWLNHGEKTVSTAQSGSQNPNDEQKRPSLSFFKLDAGAILDSPGINPTKPREFAKNTTGCLDAVSMNTTVLASGKNCDSPAGTASQSSTPISPSRGAASSPSPQLISQSNEPDGMVLTQQSRREDIATSQGVAKSLFPHISQSKPASKYSEPSDFYCQDVQQAGAVSKDEYADEEFHSSQEKQQLSSSECSQSDTEADMNYLDEAKAESPSSGFPNPLEGSNAAGPLHRHYLGKERRIGDRLIQQDLASNRSNSLGVRLRKKSATLQNSQVIRASEATLSFLSNYWLIHSIQNHSDSVEDKVQDIHAPDAESKLPLIIAKDDFAKMRVVGQFNLGFIIAVRPASTKHRRRTHETSDGDELLIIDQHASDEKFNFERLQENTVVQSQRLVHPKTLQLTALEEEIVLENLPALEANGFKIQVDHTGNSFVGGRCQLLALPLSRETTFTLKDLEELVALLADGPSGSKHIPRPSKVRKMFAMRACRSSIMIGKALTSHQMYTLLRHMGELDKPWNCPHGRPTMRHLCSLQAWDKAKWVADLPGSADTDSWLSYSVNN